ncbi:MAG TPA: DUF4837 family protein [bacterium]|nr:DUF4837 family protein [bacterium]
MKRMVFFSLVISFLIVLSCRMKANSWWIEPEIPVLVSDADWGQIARPLKDVFERVIRTPQDERLFVLKPVGTEDTRNTRAQYLILAASLESKGPVGNLVRNMLQNPDVRRQVESGERFHFVRRDLWARDQLVLILTAKDTETLRMRLETGGRLLFDLINDDLNARLEKELFARGEQKKESQELIRTYGWSIRLQQDFFTAQALPREGMVWFRRTHPERWIFVRWIPETDTVGVFFRDWVVRERDRIGKAYYGGDRVAEPYLFSYRGEFLGRPAQITTGLWENEEKVAGGPFKNYTFYDSVTETLFMLDIACFAPDRDKLSYMRRLDIIAHSFRTLFEQDR